MPFTVQDFRAKMKFDGARPNLFECSMTFPIGVVTETQPSQELFTFMCRAAQIPGSTVNQIPVNYFGRELKFAGNRIFPEWTVTIINDEDFKIHNAFEQWMNGLNSHRTNLRDSRLINNSDYQQDAYVDQFGKDGSRLKRYRLIGLFPIDISPIDLDWAANDTIEEYAVTFAYQWWEQTPQDNGAIYNVDIT
jgi:hypothetical protein